jgi:hypothetical protein
MPDEILLQYNVKVKGLYHPETIEIMSSILQLYLDNLADSIDNLSIDCELMSFSGVETDDVDQR